MNRAIPIINTARLSLRPMRPEDFDRFAEIWAKPEVVAQITGTPISRADAWERFLRNAGHWQMTGFGQWAIFDGSSRQMLGQTGFFYKSRGLGDDFDPFPEAGWVLAPEAQGRGLAKEAAEAAHDWFDRVVTGPLVALITAANAPSLKLAACLGYSELRRDQTSDGDLLLMRRNGPP